MAFVIREAAPRPTTPNQCLFQSFVHRHVCNLHIVQAFRRPGPQRSATYLLCPLLQSTWGTGDNRAKGRSAATAPQEQGAGHRRQTTPNTARQHTGGSGDVPQLCCGQAMTGRMWPASPAPCGPPEWHKAPEECRDIRTHRCCHRCHRASYPKRSP